MIGGGVVIMCLGFTIEASKSTCAPFIPDRLVKPAKILASVGINLDRGGDLGCNDGIFSNFRGSLASAALPARRENKAMTRPTPFITLENFVAMQEVRLLKPHAECLTGGCVHGGRPVGK